MTRVRAGEKGVALVGAIALMVFLGLFTTVAASVQTYGNVQADFSIYSVDVLGAVQGVSEWYMRQLDNDSDWTDNGTLSGTVNDIDVTIAIDSASADRITYSVTGEAVPGEGSYNITRSMTQTVDRNSPVTKFAVYTDYDGGRLRLFSNAGIPTSITGNVYAGGGGDVDVDNTIQGGIFYIPDDETFSADAGNYVGKQIPAAVEPVFPVLDPTAYQAVMDGYDAQLADAVAAGPSNLTLNNTDMHISAAHPRCTDDATYGVVCDVGTLLTRGNEVNITGSGTIRCATDCRLHNRSGESEGSILNIEPDDGGSITFLSMDTLSIGHANGRTDISINMHAGNTSTVSFYMQGGLATNDLLQVRGNGTEINNASNPNTVVRFYTRRRIQINDGAQIHGTGNQNLFFVEDSFPYYGDSTNNRMQIIGDSGVAVGRPTLVEGTVLVYGSRDTSDAFSISGGYSTGAYALMNGLVYQYDSTDSGECDIDDADITGSIICSRMQGNGIRRSNIVYDFSVLPDPPPDGFDSYVTRRVNSADGL